MANRKLRRWAWGIGGAGALALLLAWATWPRAELVEIARVARGPLVVTLDEEGETRVCERYVVSAPVDGTVQRIELEPGDEVAPGETVLAVFLPQAAAPLDARARAEAEAAVRAAEAGLRRATAERNVAAEELDFAESELRRVRRLAEDEVVSQQALESAELDAGCRGDQLVAADHSVDTARHQLEMARARLDGGTAAGASEATPITLYSPVAGVVLRRLHESEAVVHAGEPLLEVGDLSRLEIVADYLSSDAVRIRPGARVLVEAWGGERPLEGRVERIEPGGFKKISALGVEEQRVNVVVAFAGDAGERAGLADAFRVEVRVVVWESEDALQVPVGSLFRDGGDWAVFVVEDGRARVRRVEIGPMGDAAAAILSGLAEGDSVIVHPRQTLEAGARVAADA